MTDSTLREYKGVTYTEEGLMWALLGVVEEQRIDPIINHAYDAGFADSVYYKWRDGYFTDRMRTTTLDMVLYRYPNLVYRLKGGDDADEAVMW